jgi:hypothetical protein
MNVFVLCTGRSGSTAFYHACRHITNYTTAHEGNTHRVGKARFEYPDQHVEVDNRLSWLLGRLDEAYGDSAIYVHLTRDVEETAHSFDKRWAGRHSIIRAYAEGVLRRKDQAEEICIDYCHTVDANISQVLKDKTQTMAFHLEEAADHFPQFWERIRAEGDMERALREFEVGHNPSAGPVSRAHARLVWTVKRWFR